MVERVVWDHEAAGSKPVTRTRKSAEIIRFQRVSYVNYSIFSKSYSLIIAAQDLRCGFGKLEFYLRALGCPECGFCLQGYDRLFANKIFETDGLIKAIRIIQIGDVIHIDDPLFAECNGVVRHIDYRKKRAKIELQLFNANCFCWV